MNEEAAAAQPPDRPAVLVVDDIEANVIAMEALLSTLNCDVVRARTGNEALRQLLKRDFAVMLLDVQMPEMDGFEVARYARDNPGTRDVPIVFVTAMHETPDNLLRGYGSGAVDVLFKPVNPDVVRSKVQIFLELHLSRRRLHAEIEAHKATLAELEAFNYSVSHDLRAPLRPLDGFTTTLLADYGDKLDEKGVRHLTRIREAAHRMGQLIEDLLALSRVSRQDLRRQPVDLPAIVESILAELRAAEPTREVALVCGPVPPSRGDPRLLRIALENLLRNSWKFTHKNPTARIEFGVKPGPEAIYFIRDDGVGFDPAFADKLFEPFQRLHRASDFEGTGIGLAIVNRIIRRHDGRVWAESSVGNGATFYFTIGARGAG
jgi:two-component system sensor histidine kinase/response regulator